MKNAYRRWAVSLTAGLLAVLTACGVLVHGVDPYFHYHAPDPRAEVYFDQRYQCAGLLRTQDYETVLLGTSLAANYRASWFDVFYKTRTVKVTLPDGGFREFDRVLRYAFEKQDVRRVIFGLDPTILARPMSEQSDALPKYLYDDNPRNDAPYLFSGDAAARSLYVLRKKAAGETAPLDDAYLWDGSVYFSRELALAGYVRPPQARTRMASDALERNCGENLKIVTGWLRAHPDTHFIICFPPYSILFWDKMQRLGETDAMLEMISRAAETLLRYDNAEVQFFMADGAVITDLDNYADHIHAAGRVTYQFSRAMPAGTYRMTEENRKSVLDGLRALVVHYDYNSIWAK